MDSEEKPLFSKGDLVQLIWPLLAEQFLNVLIGMADVMMVSSLGEAAVSGVSLVDSMNYLVLQLFFAVAAGGNVVISRFIGSGDKRLAGKASAQLVSISGIVSVVIAAVLMIGRRCILSFLFGTVEEGVMNSALIYLFITSISYPFLALYNSTAACFRACGNTKTPLACNIFMNLLNLAGNAVGIYVLHLGVEGVAYPTLISRVCGSTVLFLMLLRSGGAIKIEKLSDFTPEGKIVGQMLSIGIPNSIESGVFQLGKLTLQSLVSTLETAAIAGYAVACNLASYLYLPGNCLGTAMLTIVARCCGAGRPKEAKKYAKLLVLINYAMLAVVCLILGFGNHWFIGLYNLEGLSESYASSLIVAHCIAMILWPIGFLIPYYFRAKGRAKFTMIVAITVMWIFRVGFAYIFVKFMGKSVVWIWYAMFIDWIVRVIIYVAEFFVRDEKKLRLEN